MPGTQSPSVVYDQELSFAKCLLGFSAYATLYRVVLSQLCLTLCDPWTAARQAPLSMGILQARMLEGVAYPFFRGPSRPRNQTGVSCIAGGYFTSYDS